MTDPTPPISSSNYEEPLKEGGERLPNYTEDDYAQSLHKRAGAGDVLSSKEHDFLSSYHKKQSVGDDPYAAMDE
jgi:hypothetical protein